MSDDTRQRFDAAVAQAFPDEGKPIHPSDAAMMGATSANAALDFDVAEVTRHCESLLRDAPDFLDGFDPSDEATGCYLEGLHTTIGRMLAAGVVAVEGGGDDK